MAKKTSEPRPLSSREVDNVCRLAERAARLKQATTPRKPPDHNEGGGLPKVPDLAGADSPK